MSIVYLVYLSFCNSDLSEIIFLLIEGHYKFFSGKVLVIRKVILGSSKVPNNVLECSKLLLVKSVHLVRNAHEEGPCFL